MPCSRFFLSSSISEIRSSDSVLNCFFKVSTSPWVEFRLCSSSFIVEFTAFISDLNSRRNLSKSSRMSARPSVTSVYDLQLSFCEANFT